jgi:hypothetical protein
MTMKTSIKVTGLALALMISAGSLPAQAQGGGGGGGGGGSSSGGASAGSAAGGPSRTGSAAGSPNAGAAGAGNAAVSGVPNGPGNAAGLNNSVNDPSGAGNSEKLPNTPTPQGTVGRANPASSSRSQERMGGNRANPQDAAVPGTSGSPTADGALRSNGTTMPGSSRQTATTDRDSDATIDAENRKLDRAVGSICKGC